MCQRYQLAAAQWLVGPHQAGKAVFAFRKAVILFHFGVLLLSFGLLL